jgi:predicted O-linked N-acetylglucosamine transferase (SPINDLY family)
MGLPVVTLAGNTHVSRVGVSLLNNAGFPELVADSEDEYVRIAVELSQDIAKLADTRSKRREILMNSQLLNAPSFAHEMESLFRQIWTTWVNSTSD